MTVTLHNVSLIYDQHTLLFDQFNFTLTPQKFSCILGPSGVGKTSLLRLIAKLITPERGEVISQHMPSYMAQTDLLLPWLNAIDNAQLGAKLRGEKSKQTLAQAQALFSQLGLQHAEKKFPHELSSGMRQRVALARTLLENREIILMDEPFSALDAITRFELQTLTATLLKNRTVLLVTHDPTEALRLADEIYVLAGLPAHIHTTLQLTTMTPRDLSDPEIAKHQAILFDALLQAKGAAQ